MEKTFIIKGIYPSNGLILKVHFPLPSYGFSIYKNYKVFPFNLPLTMDFLILNLPSIIYSALSWIARGITLTDLL